MSGWDPFNRPVTASFSWTQPICLACWDQRNPGQNPVQIVPEFRDEEKCCYCGKTHRSGIYVRVDPQDVPYATRTRAS